MREKLLLVKCSVNPTFRRRPPLFDPLRHSPATSYCAVFPSVPWREAKEEENLASVSQKAGGVSFISHGVES